MLENNSIKCTVLGLGTQTDETIKRLSEESHLINLETNFIVIPKIDDSTSTNTTCIQYKSQEVKHRTTINFENFNSLLKENDILFLLININERICISSINKVLQKANEANVLFSLAGVVISEAEIAAISLADYHYIAELQKEINSVVTITALPTKSQSENHINSEQHYYDQIYYLFHAIISAANHQGIIGVDLNDLQTVLFNSGCNIINVGQASGKDCFKIATKKALLNAKLSGVNVSNTKSMFTSITSNKDIFYMEKYYEVANLITNNTSQEATHVIANSFDDSLTDVVISIVLAGAPFKWQTNANSKSNT